MTNEKPHNNEAIAKLQQLVDKIDIGMLCTYPKQSHYVHAVSMSRRKGELNV